MKGFSQSSSSSALVADDNTVNRKVATIILKRFGFSVSTVINGQEAVEACRNNQFDVVLMDLSMPLMDGFQACAAIQAEHGDEAPKILALTAHVTEDVRRKCANSGFFDYVVKPVNVRKLAQILQDLPSSVAV